MAWWMLCRKEPIVKENTTSTQINLKENEDTHMDVVCQHAVEELFLEAPLSLLNEVRKARCTYAKVRPCVWEGVYLQPS